ncbi:hypothetical protein EPUS_03394 [Endocarpon pusillum Z07020]|uniref:Prion-inhibition and propagation HeLo domain-containing protein n=1 Tax=Endocarpon pusillum (strain Z07020 / HMAS-L-300199) TaxID=1263415 RepID=U1HXN5_ENDPU|nr:uncharacterized protein EPUS_03394 [Endocarpon pusillum Z07020]ERF74204.1 hypothetical protein EPUS_03394 [Endocarpon pusillum Z07020]
MATGFDIAAGIAGVTSLCITLFHGCVKGISIISEARQMGQSVERLSLMLEWEQFRLLRWGERAGLCDNSPENTKLNWNLVHELLSHLHSDLTDAKRLKEKYNLDVFEEAVTEGGASAVPDSSSSKSFPGRKNSSLLGRSWAYASPGMRKSRAQIIQQKASTFSKLKWSEFDQDKTRRLLADITYFNNALQELLDDAHQLVIKNGMAALLRDLISRSTDGSEVETIQAFLHEDAVADTAALEAVSQVKQTRLILGVDRRFDEGSSAQAERPKLTKVKYENLSKFQPVGEDGKREVAEYKTSSSKRTVHSYVLLEWKRVDKKTDQKIKRRIMELALLMGTSSNNGFNSLKCLGFLERNMPGQDNRYAYVFEIVDLLNVPKQDVAPTPPTPPTPLSLRSVLKLPRKPSLTERIAMSLAVAETALQMHTAGWLHKGICADAILFINAEQTSWQKGTSLGPYVAGYEFSRNSLEETETVPFDVKQALYWHPAMRDFNQRSDNLFRKEYDLHSLGCVLLEISLWSSLEDILRSIGDQSQPSDPPSTTGKSESQINYEKRLDLLQRQTALKERTTAGAILDQVAFAGGNRLREALELCFFPQLVTHREPAGDEEISFDLVELSVEAQLSIVEILRSLCQNV